MIMRFVINQRLPGLNEVIHTNRTNVFAASDLKARTDAAVVLSIKRAMMNGECSHTSLPVRIRFIWHEKTRRRDPDNIFSAKKFVLDAMQKAKIIDGDGQRHIKGLADELVNDKNDFVEVEIETVE